MMSVKFTKNHFEQAKKVSWEDVIQKISYEYEYKTHKTIFINNDTSPTIVLRNNIFPGTLQEVFNEIKSEIDIKDLHVYVSFGKNSSTFGRHDDPNDVIIIQAIGSVYYAFDDGTTFTLNPGDSLFIPKGIYHNQITLSPRITLSFSWENKFIPL